MLDGNRSPFSYDLYSTNAYTVIVCPKFVFDNGSEDFTDKYKFGNFTLLVSG